MEEYRSRSIGVDLPRQQQQQQREYGFGIASAPRPNASHAGTSLRSTPVRLSSSREQSPAVNKSSPDNSSMSNDVGHQTKDKPHRRFNLFRRKPKVTEPQPNQQNACSSGGEEWDSSSSVSSSSNANINNNNNNNLNSQNRSSLLSTLSRKCSKKFRNLTRNENNSQKPEPSSQNGVHVSGDVCSNHVLSGGSNEGGGISKRQQQQKADGHHGKFDLFSSCRKVPGSPRDSLDSISRRVRKDALKARVEAQREQQYPDSSSDDEEQFSERASYLRRYHSDESLQNRWPAERQSLPKVNRTERYYRRRGKEDDSSSKCDDYVVQPRKDISNNPTNIRRNLTFGGSASPCSSPQPGYQRVGQNYRSNYSRYEEIKIQSSQYLTPGVRTTQRSTREESNIENIVVSGYLPLRKASLVDGHVHRAPTPPLRSTFTQPQPQPRPQSFNFGDVNVSNGRRHVRGNGALVTGPSAATGPMTLVMSSSETPLRNESGRPLSFTSTSHVIYNHHAPSNNVVSNNNFDFMSISAVENGGRNRVPHLSTSPETPPVAYMSDSQISGRSRSSKSNQYESAWRKQSQQLNRNFNSVPKPWNTVSSNDENCPTNNSRPPPSPSRNSESFNFGVPSTNGPLSPKYSTQMQSSKVVLPRNQQQPLQTTRKYPNIFDDTPAPLPPTRKYFRQQQSRSSNLESVGHRLGKLVNGNNNVNNSSSKCKLSDNHLEDALLELEKIYHSMKKDDDDDAEEHSKRRNSTCEDLLLHSNKDRETENTVQLVVDGLGSYNTLEGRPRSALGNRNGSIPNKVTDDLAYRKISRQAELINRPSYMATGSYLLRSPALSPSVSIDDVRTAKVGSSSIIIGGASNSNEPDTVLDDLSFRNIRDANLQKVIDPQPPFGIPLGPISNAASTDYMHAQAQDLSRPKMRRRFRPDLVKDDLAYRNLRKDGDKVENAPASCLNFDELDSILSGELQAANRKKHRAARSLSANLSQIISQNKMLGSSSSSSVASIKVNSTDEKSLSVSDLRSTGQNVNLNEPIVKNQIEPVSNNATSSSTDTLTDFGPTQQPPLVPLRQQGFNGPASSFRPLPEDDLDPSKPINDIWQVRVTMGSEPNNQSDGKLTGHPLVKPIPLKLESFRGTSHRFGSVLDDDSHAKTKGSPIDEVKLDELLSSLALDTVQPTPVVTCNGQQSIGFSDKSKCDAKPPVSETFPALVTVDGSGEMSVKILFPNLMSDSNDTTPYGNGIEEQGRLVNRVFKVASGPSRGGEAADDRNRKEMSSVPARPRSFIANQCVDEKFVGSRIGVRSPLTVKKDVKDGLTSSERPVTLKRSAAFHSKSSASTKITETAPANGNSTMPDSESHSDRIARYKEERRKQLANQFGQWSTREDGSSLGNEPSYMRYSQRTSKKGTTETATNGSDVVKVVSRNEEESTIKKTTRVESNHKDENNKTSNEIASKDNERTSPVDSMVRLNRASRLRAQARANETTAPEFSNRSGSFRSSRNTFGANSSKDSTPVKTLNRSATPISSSSEAPINSTQAGANNQPIGNESESGGTASDTTTGRLKDKSAKRKSNLNRMGSVDNNTPIPSDSGDDTSRRFRRHRYSFADKSSNCSTDGVQSDSLKSSRAVRALQPQTTLPTSPSKSSTKSNSSLEKKEEKAVVKSGYIEDGTSESDADRKSNSRKLKRTTLKRPEIPDIFRSKGSAVPDENGDHKPSSFAHLPNDVVKTKSPAVELNDEITLKLKYCKAADSSPTTFSTRLQTPSIDTNAQKPTLDVAKKNNELKTRENYLSGGSSYKFNHFSGVTNTKTGDMGGRLFKDASNVDADVPSAEVSVSSTSNHDVDDESVSVEREHYDPSGNWHLGKPADTSADVVIRTSKCSTMFGDQNDVKTKNRMAVAYGSIKDVNSHDAGSSTGETSGWPTPSSPSVPKKTHNVKIPVNADDSSSRRSDSSDELWLSIENEMKKRHAEMESGGSKPAVIIVEGSSASVSPRRKKSDEVELPTKSILKSKEDTKSVDGRPPIPHSILKRGSIDEVSRSRSPEKCSILKKRGSSEESDHRSDSPEIVSILRRKSTEEAEDSERHSILRRKSMLDETEHTRSPEYHSILKKQCSLDAMDASHSEPKPILKKKSSTEEIEQSEPKPILKKRSSTEDEYEDRPKPILKTRRRSGHEDLMEMEPVDQVEMRRTSRHKTSSPVLRFKQDELPSVPNRLSSTSSRHLTTSSEEEFVSVPSSPGSWMQRKSIEEDDHDLTSSQRWERNAAYSLLNGKDGLSPLKDVDDLPFVDSSPPRVSSKFDEEMVGGDTSEKKLSSSSSSSSDSSTEEEEESEDEDESQETEEEEEETEPSSASITAGKPESVSNDASVQSTSSPRLQDEKHPTISTNQSASERTTIGSESVHVKSEAVICKSAAAPVVTRHQSSSTYLESELDNKRGERIAVASTSKVEQVESSSSVQRTVEVVKAKIPKVNQTDVVNSSGAGDDQEDVTRLSVAERASLFMQKLKSQKQTASTTQAQPAPVSRFVNRRGLQRSQTQPVTVCEVNEASKIAEEAVKRQRHSVEYEDVETITSTTKEPVDSIQGKSGTSESDDDPSKLSLADRVKLFNQKMIEERLPTRKMSSTEEDIAGSPPKEKPRRSMISRFKTQPVTSEELEKAQMISSLESHFAKQQQEIKIVPKEPSESLCTSQTNTSTDDYKPKGILKKKEDVHVSHVKSAVESKNGSVTNAKSDSVSVSKSIETKVSNKTSATELKSILKMDTYIKQASGLKSVKGKQEESSSSSDNDDEDESEGFTINLRNGSSNVVSRGSTDEDSSSHSQSSSLSSGSGRQETGKQIKNEAVSRRRKAAIRKQEERKSSEIQLSQSINLAQSFEQTSTTLRSVLSGELIQRNRKAFPQRSSTQPLTQMEKDGAVLEIKGGSIAERLAALKASQEEDWKRRLERNKASEVVDGNGSPSIGEDCKMIHEKVILLEGSQQEWKRRVEEKDATKFTVAGKMGKVSPPHESPVLDRKRRVPKPTRFQSRTCANLPELAKGSPVSTLPPKCSSITRSKSLGDAKADSLNEEKSLTRVSVPKPDDEGFSSFFESANLDNWRSQKIEIQEEAFNQLVSESRQFLVQKRSVHVTRHHARTRNPLKTLAAREDLQDEYTETVTGVAEKELRRLRVEQLAKHSDLATSALAGLASTEDFTSVSLRKSSSVVNASLLPYKDIMLIQVKGRRHVQCRLVEPVIASLNKGDNFILVTTNEVYNWIGEFSNVIERVKGAEISTIIQTKRDLGYKGSGEVVTFDEEKHTGGRGKRRDFFERLGGQDDIADPGSPEDDEIYEAAISETNKVFLVEGDELVPYEKYWGSLLRTEMLVNTEVLVFDFGGEMYVWQGKLAPNELRKKAVQLAQELWDDGYDYSECDINPISPSRNNVPKYGKKRPPWALFSKINQHMETVLFRSKFLDWPDLERVIQVRRQESDNKNDGYADLQPYDAQLMIDAKPSEPDLILENCHLGRGVHYWDETERRLCNISKLGVKVWHVLEYNHSILPLESWGQFHSNDTYVVRWQYRVAVTGRDLSGQVSKHCALGRERCAYFFWQGRYSTINEKGASALMTVELDEERGPHIRVDQGQEHPCFLNLFEGKMICYKGKRGDEASKVNWRLFILRGELESEAHLVEIKCTYRSLRESGVFVLVDCSGGIVYMWTGGNVQNHSKDVARFVVENLVQRRPVEMGFRVGMLIDMKEEEQGSESKEFLEGIGGVSQSQIRAVMPKIQTVTCTPRLFHMTSVSGAFLVSEVFCSFRSCEHVVSYPFHQNDIYLSPQPSIFLLDRGNEIYVWQGWWPVNSDENETSGSAHLRWNVERRLALETAVNYCNAKGKENPPAAYTVWAGLEPPEFKHFFPEWEDFDEATESNKMNGRNEGEKKLVADVLAQLKRTRYPLAELMERPLPEGVDPSIIETYLTDDDFEEVLKTNREEFNALPAWKQFNIKKSAGLY